MSADELLYVPVTREDEARRGDLRYRVGRRLGGRGAALATCVTLGFPIAIVLDWLDDRPPWETAGAAAIGFIALWLLGVVALYAWCFYKRQDWSELRRASRFRRPGVEDAAEVLAAKQVLLDGDSTSEGREHAISVLSEHGACVPNRVSVLREALTFLAVGVVVFGGLSVLVWWL